MDLIDTSGRESLEEFFGRRLRKPPAPVRPDLSRIARQEHPVEATTPRPILGAKFEYQGKTYAITGYMRQMQANEPRRIFGRRGIKATLIATDANDATYVIGMGGGGPGCIAPMNAIHLTGETADWSLEQMDRVKASGHDLIARRYTVNLPS